MRTAALAVATLAWLPTPLPAQPAGSSGPPPTRAGIAYAPAEPADSQGHLLDLYLPEQGDAPFPVVIWTGGSAWLAENGRMRAGLVAENLNPAGYAVAGVSIRSSTSAPFPAQLHDVKAAIRWLRLHAAEHGLDPGRIAIMGDSSGGWTAAMAALTGDAPELEGAVGAREGSSAVRSAVAFYPPTDFLLMDAHAIGECENGVGKDGAFCHDGPESPESRLVGCPIQTCPEAVQRANPVSYVSPADPPLLILHGGADPLVPFHQGELLYEALSAACRDATFVALPHAKHGPVAAFLSDDATRAGATLRATGDGCTRSGPEPFTPTWQTVIDFLGRTTR
jgi:acetyl esterase/lipase